MIELLKHDDPRLLEKAKEVTYFSDEVKEIVSEMAKVMYATHGVGLAAPQIGHSLRIIIVDVNHVFKEDRNLRVYFNPQIVDRSALTCVKREGCLSVPGIIADIERPIAITFKALNENFEQVQFDAGELLSRTLQHEVDHLDGVLFTDRLPDKNPDKKRSSWLKSRKRSAGRRKA